MYMKNVYKNLTPKTNMRFNNKTKQKPQFQNTVTVGILV